MAVTTNNTPDLAVGDPNHRFVFTAFYIIVSLFNLILASGIILAIINQKYHEIFKEEFTGFEGLNEYQLTLLEGIQEIEENKFSNYDEFEEFVLTK